MNSEYKKESKVYSLQCVITLLTFFCNTQDIISFVSCDKKLLCLRKLLRLNLSDSKLLPAALAHGIKCNSKLNIIGLHLNFSYTNLDVHIPDHLLSNVQILRIDSSFPERCACIIDRCPNLKHLLLTHSSFLVPSTCRLNLESLVTKVFYNLSFLVNMNLCYNIRKLDLICDRMQNIDSLSMCTKLQDLSLQFGHNDCSLDVIGQLTNLIKLNLQNLHKVSSLEFLSQCVLLQSLHLTDVHDTIIPYMKKCTLLEDLSLTRCYNMENLNFFLQIPSLTSINLDVTHVGSFFKNQYVNLTYLKLENVTWIPETFHMTNLPHLRTLNLLCDNKLQYLHVDIPCLQDLHICCNSLEILHGTENLSNLKSLYVKAGFKFTLHGFILPANLEELYFFAHDTFSYELNCLINEACECKSSLRKLSIIHYGTFTKMREILSHFTKLEQLNYTNNLSGQDFTCDMPFLKRLHTTHQMANLDSIQNCTSLEELNLDIQPNLKCIAGLTKCIKLTSLRLYNGNSCIKDYTPLSSCPNLQKLFLASCSISSLGVLFWCCSLREIILSDCKSLCNLHGLGRCPDLRKLNVSNTDYLVSLKGIGGCHRLKQLHITFCSKLNDVSQISDLTLLDELSFVGCSILNYLPSMKKLDMLQSLNIHLTNIKILRASINLPSLTRISINGNGSVKYPPELKDKIISL
jgi:hypothetical protein